MISVLLVLGLVAISAACWSFKKCRDRRRALARAAGGAGNDPLVDAHGEVLVVTETSRQSLGLDCLLAPNGTSSQVRHPVYAEVSGPLLGWPGPALVDFVSRWKDSGQRIFIGLSRSSRSQPVKARLSTSSSFVVLDVDNPARMRRRMLALGS